MATEAMIGAAATARRSRSATSPWALSHRDEEREQLITRTATGGAPNQEDQDRIAQRERILAAVLIIRRREPDLDDLLGMVDVSEAELCVAREVAARLEVAR
ncbi:hypothetical protein ACIBG7_43065 [Nonomuraea sp. NPDC050328]|uniref:hypothetical protein n=1 Tax=Nonomuraea sp. NPDC050328 TaxID=3364361 RepID=UPI0037BC6F96